MFTAVRANQATSECVKVFKPLHVFHTLCVVDNFKHTRVQCLPITTDKSKPFFANVLKTKVFIAMQSVQKVKGSQFSVHAKMFYFFVCTHALVRSITHSDRYTVPLRIPQALVALHSLHVACLPLEEPGQLSVYCYVCVRERQKTFGEWIQAAVNPVLE